jgi:hypothetical protein
MNQRRRRIHIHIGILRADILVGALLLGMIAGALIRWPEKAVADIAIPMALLIAFVLWRRS